MWLRVDDMKRHEFNKRRRSKNIALGVILLVLAALFYLITIVKFGERLDDFKKHLDAAISIYEGKNNLSS